jgi:hypothetical protein
MGQEDVMVRADRVFEILSTAIKPDEKLYACLAFLTWAPSEFHDEFPREAQAIVRGAIANGAAWSQVAEAAKVSVAEAQRRWETAQAALQLGNSLYEQGDREGALNAIRRAVRSNDPVWGPQAELRLGLIQIKEMDLAAAKATMHHVAECGDAETAQAAQSTLDILSYVRD